MLSNLMKVVLEPVATPLKATWVTSATAKRGCRQSRSFPSAIYPLEPDARANSANNSNSARRNPARSRALSHPSTTSRSASVITSSASPGFWLRTAEIRRSLPNPCFLEIPKRAAASETVARLSLSRPTNSRPSSAV